MLAKSSVFLFIILICATPVLADDIWTETFSIPEKGYWGGGNDMSGITAWTIDASACTLTDASDYIKTVATSGGRMEAKDIDGEAVWTSELIDITGYTNIVLSMLVSETGSSTNVLKYVKVYYKLDGGIETLFETNGENIGNFGSLTASQAIAAGTNIQIVVRINNPNTGDATIFDNVTVTGDPPDTYPPNLVSVATADANNLVLKFDESVEQTTAENILNYTIDNSVGNPQTAVLNGADPTIVNLSFANPFASSQNYGLNITNVQDLSGNAINDTLAYFTYIPFVVNNIFVINKNELVLDFSRNLDPASSSIIVNYTIDNAIGNPTTAVLQTDNKQVKLSFSTDFITDTELNLHIENLEDENNIIMDNKDTAFYWHIPVPYDLTINEIMADPVPSVNLPEYEFVEIYNKTDYAICLQNWNLVVGATARTFPLQNIQPGEYLLICSQSAQAELDLYGNTVGILANTDLINAGKELALQTSEQLTIDSLNYTIEWYQNEDKDNGGWSLERIDHENTCGKLSNWQASEDVSGGTPGRQNSIYKPNIDLTAAKLTGINLFSSSELILTFNEELKPEMASEVLNFLLDNAINPTASFLGGEKQNIIQITFQNEFSIGENSLRITNIEDLCSNSIGIFDTTFSYYPGNEFDILINEVMFDLSPEPNVLPPAKYIEIYNQTDLNIDLSDWALQIDDHIKHFSDIQLAAKSYLILSDDDEADLFSNYGQVYGIFSSSNLGSSRGQISLFNRNNLLIDYLNYSADWYGDSDKNSGGWSLERIDYLNYCGLNTNWLVTDDYKGGTPGSINSVFVNKPDESDFEIVNIKVLSSSKIALQFSKNIKEEQALNVNNYLIDNGPGNPIFVNFSDTSRSTIILQFASQFTDAFVHTLSVENLLDYCENSLILPQKEFTYFLINPESTYAESKTLVKVIFSEEVEIVTAQQTENYLVEPDIGNPFKAYKHNTNTNVVYLEFDIPFENGKEYTVHIENVKDLNGNAIRAAELTFSYFEPEWNDIVINEVLFNPKAGGVDFVEIYNNSIYPVDLKHLRIAKRNNDGDIESVEVLSEENSKLLPATHLAITSDSSLTKTNYPAISYEGFSQVNSMPSYSDDMGTVVLLFQDTIIDEFTYANDMHLALISDVNGVSLERLNPDNETSDPQNWFSAAESVGFATPANKNSQFTEFSNEIADEILIEPEVFSPNNDGYDDRTFIRYKFNEPGYIGSVTIFNSNGQLIKRIANNELLAIEGSFSWDGLYENNQRVTIGIYIVYFEVFNLQGEVKHYKKTCVVAAKLN